jgi:hypothetical protein
VILASASASGQADSNNNICNPANLGGTELYGCAPPPHHLK